MQVINKRRAHDSVVIRWSTSSPATPHPEPVVYLFDADNTIFYDSPHLSKLSGATQLVRENDTQTHLKRKFMDVMQKKLTVFDN
jgi:hypothetical protein